MTHDSIIHLTIIHEACNTLAAVFPSRVVRSGSGWQVRPPNRGAGIAVAALLIVALAGCGSGDQAGDTSATAAQAGCSDDSTSGREGVNLLPIPPAKVTVLDAGGADRRTAAAAPDRTSPQSSTMVTTSSVLSPGDTTTQSVEMPLQARFHCTDSTDLEMTLGHVTSPEPVLADQLRAVENSRAGLAIGPGGMPISLRLLPAEDAGPEARSAVEQSFVQALQLSVPVPTEPIGPGARWQVERVISGAATVTQHIDATLKSWDGNRLVVAVTVDETPVNSVFAIPGSDQTLSIARFSNGGTGQVTIDLTRGLPVAGSIELSGARALVGSDPARPLIQQTGLSVRWR
ncbi:hypothetical protein [Gordonia hankookensis]|uniref:Uncharacterized protein n=1 Tax=Gordonia hankookensis TaxID=589403 RepID=A0ABR7W5I4_9ACTN|nr:hypothetical protein [Gordonia hankookensis]MBD1318082.1 hypothetical protein [Gordonia hankookensis]